LSAALNGGMTDFARLLVTVDFAATAFFAFNAFSAMIKAHLPADTASQASQNRIKRNPIQRRCQHSFHFTP
jgi:hypothetical protein